MIRLDLTSTIIISGNKFVGKSTIAKHFTEMYERHVIYDTTRDFTNAGFQNVYVPTGGSIEEFERFCCEILKIGNMMVVVDEAQQVLPEGRDISKCAFQLVMYGRHSGIGLIATTKRPAILNKTVFEEANYLMLFRHMIPNDVKYLKQIVGDRAEELQKLPNFQFMIYDNSGGPKTGSFTGPWILRDGKIIKAN